MTAFLIRCITWTLVFWGLFSHPAAVAHRTREFRAGWVNGVDRRGLGVRRASRARPRRFPYDPYRLLAVQGGLYCVGKVPAYENFVTLAMDRIRSLELAEESFSVDPAFDPKRYEAEAFGVAWEKPMTVVVRFSADQAPYMRERQWYPTQRLRELADGRVELTFRAGGRFEILRWGLSWGDAAEVVRPPALRREIVSRLRSATPIYLRRRRQLPAIEGRQDNGERLDAVGAPLEVAR